MPLISFADDEANPGTSTSTTETQSGAGPNKKELDELESAISFMKCKYKEAEKKYNEAWNDKQKAQGKFEKAQRESNAAQDELKNANDSYDQSLNSLGQLAKNLLRALKRKGKLKKSNEDDDISMMLDLKNIIDKLPPSKFKKWLTEDVLEGYGFAAVYGLIWTPIIIIIYYAANAIDYHFKHKV